MTWRGTCKLALGAWGRLFWIQPSCLLFFYPQMIQWRKWVNSAFRKTPLFKNCRCERLSLLYISKIEYYNPISALLLTLVCHFYHVLLRVAIFVLNVAIATYFQRRQKKLSTKTLLWKIYRCKVVQFFTAQPCITPGAHAYASAICLVSEKSVKLNSRVIKVGNCWAGASNAVE